MPFDVNSTKLDVDEVRILSAMIQVVGRLDKELHGMEEVMPDTDFIARCDRALDLLKDLRQIYTREIRKWRRDVINQ